MSSQILTGRPADTDTTRDAVVRLTDVRRHFGETPAIDGVTLTVRKGEILGLIGRSGAGKSTLIRCLNGLERPDSGSIEIEGREITGLSEQAMQPLRRRIGMIFQHFNLLSAKTVEENVALPLKIEGWPRKSALTGRPNSLNWSVLPARREATRPHFPAGRSSVSGLPGRLRPVRRCSSRTRRPLRSTRKRPRQSSTS